ncbi:hypothetical protein [Erwinia persicina]|nr:hypothetical protein [Erwinia persicina]
MKEKKTNYVPVRLNDTQIQILDRMIDGKNIKNRGQAIQALITIKGIFG